MALPRRPSRLRLSPRPLLRLSSLRPSRLRRRLLSEAREPPEEDGSEAQEGESVADRPDSPDDLDEAAGDGEAASEAEEPSES